MQSSPLILELKPANENQVLELIDLQTTAFVRGGGGPYVEAQYIHTYKNPQDSTIEAEFHFTRSEARTFYKFEAVFANNQTITQQILPKEPVMEVCGWNDSQVRTMAYYYAPNPPPPLSFKVGKIPSNETVQIRFSVLWPLEIIGNNELSQLNIPVGLPEKYLSEKKQWKVQVELESKSPFTNLSNPSHNFKPVEFSSEKQMDYKASWNVTIIPDKDFIVNFVPEKLQTILGTHPQDHNDQVLLVNYYFDVTALKSKIALAKLPEQRSFTFQIQCLTDDNQTIRPPGLSWLVESQLFRKWIYSKNGARIKSCTVTLSGWDQGKVVLDQVDIHECDLQETTDIWHKVAFDTEIKQLQKTAKGLCDAALDLRKTVVVKLSEKYQVMSDFTWPIGFRADQNGTGDYLCNDCEWCNVDFVEFDYYSYPEEDWGDCFHVDVCGDRGAYEYDDKEEVRLYPV